MEAVQLCLMVVYLPEREAEIQNLLGPDWDPGLNRLDALAAAEAATVEDPTDAFAWFNVGSNLVYFGRYDEANAAYDRARELGLPQRMFRYQFGPFIANFQANRTDDLLALTDYALQRTEMSEETWLWHGWALYRRATPPARSRTGARPYPSARAMRMRCTPCRLWARRRSTCRCER
jgi:tetratricopeptide (TPR) repeat protein